ncbi:MAG: prepilin peptidase [Candidatus Latescibacterota bacterium]|nr:MAG: prepilin peptidase [Candidatus Latescibacterota bacterium]
MFSDPYAHAIALIAGLLVGSFLNVLIVRLPRNESVVGGRSRCTTCRKTIAWYDNIPVISFIALKGRCRHCRSPISIRYLIVELISGGIAVALVAHFGFSLLALWMYVFLAILLVITLVDWSHQIIPDVLSLGGIVLGWTGAVVCLPVSLPDSLIGAFAGGGVLYGVGKVYKIIRKAEGMGGGDVKLMGMIGAFLGWQMVFPVLLIASFFGAAYGIYLLIRGESSQTPVAFGSFLAPAAAVVLIFGAELWRGYMGFFLR